MIIDDKNKQMQMEERDANYILPAYVKSYLFYSKNEMPERIIVPMLPSISVAGKTIPIEYVPYLDPQAIEIAHDGAEVIEVTPEQEALLDEKDDRVQDLKADMSSMDDKVNAVPTSSPSPAKSAMDRIPKMPPSGDIGPGLSLSDTHNRDSRDQVRTAKDLAEGPDVNEAEEKDFGKAISRDNQGKPVVKEA